MSYPWRANLESGRARNPTVEVLTRLAVLYGHAPAELLPGAA
jgi:transcriptional regulator with XRE-family HTH domain